MVMNVCIETYGCSANQSDSEIMAGLLTQAGFDIVHDPELADIIIINTCIVKGTTERRVISKIKKIEKSEKKLVVAGCMPEAMYKQLREITKVPAVGPYQIKKIVSIVKAAIEGKQIEALGGRCNKTLLPKIRRNPVIDIIQIQHGCLSACSFCITRKARGSLHSESPDSISREVLLAHKAGVKEFWFTGQDTGCYGFDMNTNLAELINKVTTNVKGKYFIRLGMMNPQHAKQILSELIEAYKHDQVFKFLHIPVQSGSNRILTDMRRGHDVEDFVSAVEQFRRNIPGITIWTDIIVGYPGETDKDFQKTIDLLKKIQPDYTNISRFTTRPGTEAAKEKQLPTEIKKQRSRVASKIVDKICLQQNKRWVDWSGIALVDEYNRAKQTWIARNYAYKPIVLKGQYRLGQFVKVKIKEAATTHLVGVAI